MKQILVLTDYSACAKKAMQYAVELAQTIKAQLHFCHAIDLPAANAFSDLNPLPALDNPELREEAVQQLREYVAALQKNDCPALDKIPFTCSTGVGTATEVAQKLAQAQKINLIVMGLTGTSAVRRLLLGSNSRQMIDSAPVPVLLIPENAGFVPLKKIGFATDLTESDLNAIHEVALLFSAFDPELLLTHVSAAPSDFHDPRTPANQFLNRVTCKINYAKIYYRHITQADINEGLLWISEHGRMDMMAMIHRKTSGLSAILRGSYTQKMADMICLPLLVMPENHEPIGW